MTLAKISRRYPMGSYIKYLGDDFTVPYEDYVDDYELKDYPVKHNSIGKVIWYLTDNDVFEDPEDFKETFQCFKTGEMNNGKNYIGILVEWASSLYVGPIVSELYIGKDIFTRELA